MGANAQTAVPTFTASQVLTAAQMNQSARTGVPVFATTGDRDAAFGGTGEKTLAEGQLCYVETTGLQSYNGSTWQTWGAVPSRALTLVASQTIGTGVASVSVSNCFSSTYENYLITASGGVGSTNLSLRMTLGSTAAGYYQAGQRNYYDGSAVFQINLNNAAYWEFGIASANTIDMSAQIFQPNTAKRTSFVSAQAITLAANTGFNQFAGGFLNDATQYTGFTLTTSAGTVTGGTIRVYGYQNS